VAADAIQGNEALLIDKPQQPGSTMVSVGAEGTAGAMPGPSSRCDHTRMRTRFACAQTTQRPQHRLADTCRVGPTHPPWRAWRQVLVRHGVREQHEPVDGGARAAAEERAPGGARAADGRRMGGGWEADGRATLTR
jgi:hypothetical protein